MTTEGQRKNKQRQTMRFGKATTMKSFAKV